MRLGVEDQLLLVLVATDGIHGEVPRRRIIKSIGANTRRHIVMVDLTHPRRKPAGVFELLRKRHHIRHFVAEVTIKVVDFDLIGSQSRHHRGTGRIAQRKLIVGPIKPHATRRQSIDMRGLRHQITVTRQARREIIDGDEKDIGSI